LRATELEEYAENLRKVRKLTSEEEKDLRRQRRLIKNRESAQLSRVRRREHMEVIEQQLQEVQNENARLKLQVESLTTENLQLKQHIASSSSLAPAVAPPRSPLLSATETDEPSPSLIKMVQGWTTLGKGATATAVKATYLFVRPLLLSTSPTSPPTRSLATYPHEIFSETFCFLFWNEAQISNADVTC
jgi:hypothetical protein